MADDVKFEIDADGSGAEREWAKVIKQNETLRQKLIDLGKTSKQVSKEATDGNRAQNTALADMAGKINIVGMATQAVTRLYAEWAQEAEHVKTVHKDLAKTMVETIAAGKDLASAPAIEKMLKDMKGIKISDATKAFGAATAAAPGMDFKARGELISELAPLAPAGSISGMAGMGAKLSEILPGRKMGDIADLSAYLTVKGGEDAAALGGDEFMTAVSKLKAAGMPAERSIGIGLSGVEAGLPSKAITGIASALAESDPSAGSRRGPMTAEDRLKSSFYKLGAEGRFGKLSSDPKTAEAILGPGGALNMSLIGDARESERGIMGAMSGDYVKARAADLSKWDTGRAAISEYKTAVRTEKADDRAGRGVAAAERLSGEYSADFRESGVGFLSRTRASATMWGASTAAGMVGADRSGAVELATRTTNALAGASGLETGAGAGLSGVLNILITALNRNSAATEKDTRRMPKAIVRDDPETGR